MKKELLTLVAGSAMFASFANAEIVLTEELSAYGYIDTAYTTGGDASDLDGSVAEFELGFAFKPVASAWSAYAELSFDGETSGDKGEDGEVEFEKVVISYDYSEALSFTVGNILSYQGFETKDATGLYQYSYQGKGDKRVYSAGYEFGVAADYVTDSYALGFWVGEGNGDEASFEYFAQYTAIDGLTLTAVLADDGAYDTTNLWASYEVDAFTFALEYTSTSADNNADTEAYMAFVYYAMGGACLTARYSTGEDTSEDFDKYTVSPSYAFSDSVFGLVEYSYLEVESKKAENILAAELIFSF